MTYLLSVDPGLSTGIVLGEYGDEQPWTRLGAWQISGGVSGFRDWFRDNTDVMYGEIQGWEFTNLESYPSDRIGYYDLTWISERYVPLSGGGFAQTSDTVEPVRIEGILKWEGWLPDDYSDKRWQRPAAMYFSSGSNKAERLKASRAFLKSHDLLLTGKDVGQKDADDAISATLHSLAFMRKIKHAPSLLHFWPKED